MDTIEQKDAIEPRQLTKFQKKQVLSLVDRFQEEKERQKMVVFHLLFLFRNIDQNSEVLCHSLDYRVAGNLIVENHRCPTSWRTQRTLDSAFLFSFLVSNHDLLQ